MQSPPRYIYKLTASRGTTGYAACAPEPEPDFGQALALLESRPLDTFLHRHLLGKMLELAPAEWTRLARNCGSRPLACLLLESARLAPHLARPDVLPGLRRLAEPWQDGTPLPLLAGAMTEKEKEARENLRRNIHQHTLAAAACRAGAAPRLNAAFPLARRGRDLGEPAVAEPLPDAKETAARALKALAENDIASAGEMRHEASLCPIALLRPWRLKAGAAGGKNAHTLEGEATAYGRGLTLAQARASCLMEIVERACAHAFAGPEEIGGHRLIRASWRDLAAEGIAAIAPSALGAIAVADSLPLRWIAGEDAGGARVFAPAQAVYLFCNLDEVSVCEHIGSTGLASGVCPDMAKLAALTEVLERDAHATTPFRPEDCFELQSRDRIIQGLLEDYRWRGIAVQFQDISNEFGFPVYRAFARRRDGSLAQATGAGMRGARAALAALTETPFPYAWATPARTPSAPGLRNLPQRTLEDLPDYSLPSIRASLARLEETLAANGHHPVYVDISRRDLGFPVYRAFIPGLANDPEFETGIHPRLWARLASKELLA